MKLLFPSFSHEIFKFISIFVYKIVGNNFRKEKKKKCFFLRSRVEEETKLYIQVNSYRRVERYLMRLKRNMLDEYCSRHAEFIHADVSKWNGF